jgi:hypothetical protein
LFPLFDHFNDNDYVMCSNKLIKYSHLERRDNEVFNFEVHLGLVGPVGLVVEMGVVASVAFVVIVVGVVGSVVLAVIALVEDWSSQEFLFFFLASAEPFLDAIEESGLVGLVGFVMVVVGVIGVVASVASVVMVVGVVGSVVVGVVALVEDWSSEEFLFFFLASAEPSSLVGLVGLVTLVVSANEEFFLFFLASAEPFLDAIEESGLVGLVGFVVVVMVVVGVVGVVASVASVVMVVGVVALVFMFVGVVSESSHHVFSFIESTSDASGEILGLVPERSISVDNQRVWPGEVEWLHCDVNRTTSVVLGVISQAEIANIL